MRPISSKLLLPLFLLPSLVGIAQRQFSPEQAMRYLYSNAYMYQQRHVPDTAMLCLDMLAEIDSTYLPAINLRGYIYEEHYADYEQAMTCYQRTLRLDSSYIKAYVNIGHLYYLKRQYRDAKEQINKALAIDSTYADAWYNLGYIANEENYAHDALRYMNKAIALGSQAAVRWREWYEEQQQLTSDNK